MVAFHLVMSSGALQPLVVKKSFTERNTLNKLP